MMQEVKKRKDNMSKTFKVKITNKPRQKDSKPEAWKKPEKDKSWFFVVSSCFYLFTWSIFNFLVHIWSTTEHE